MLGGGHADEPEVDQVAQTGHDWVEEQARERSDGKTALFGSRKCRLYLHMYLVKVFIPSLFSHELPSPKNWCLKLFKY